MTKIYIFETGSTRVGPHTLFTSVALTDKGKWVAGAVSQSSQIALTRCREMVEDPKRARDRVSGPIQTIIVGGWADEYLTMQVVKALSKALESMP